MRIPFKVSKNDKQTKFQVFFETFEELNSLPYEKCSKKNQKFQLGHEKTLKRYTHEEAVKFGRVNTSDTYTFHHFHVF